MSERNKKVSRSLDMPCTKNFLIARTYLINYIYIYIIEFEKWVQETKRPKDQKVFHLVNES